MFDLIKNDIRNNEFTEALSHCYIEQSLLVHLKAESIPFQNNIDQSLAYDEWSKESSKKSTNYDLQIKYYQKIIDLLLNAYFNKTKSKTSKNPNRTSYELVSQIIDKKRDDEIIRKIEEIENEALNNEGWVFTERILNNFRTLVNECKTKDEKYISQLSYLIQAMEDNYSPILILGESGVGKSKLASIFHLLSKRKEKVKDLVELNCGAVDEEHIYPVLFGAKKGSFSSSIEELPGKVSEANGGTLFLDEIDRAPKRVQDYLLTFIATKNYQPLGYSKDKKADVIILIGTNKNPKSLVNERLMESDFYNRISKRIITIPPLRERKDDIKLIAEFCLKRFNDKYKTNLSITPDTFELLKKYPWPGNFGDVEAYLERTLSDCKWRGEKHLTPYYINNNPPDKNLPSSCNDFQNFENLMSSFLSGWETKEGSFTDEFLFPILAKIYIEQYPVGKKQTEKNELAMSIVGMNGESKKGKLYQEYLKYQKLKSKFSQ